MKFKIGDTTYDAGALDLLSLKDILMFEKETAELGNPLHWSDVGRMIEELEALKTDREREAHSSAMWVLAITIWSSRRLGGDQMSFGDAIDFPLRDLKWLPDPQDKKAPARPTKARTGSARAGNNPPPLAVATETESETTSKEASTGD
jgi:hypothetical protein